MSTTKPTQDRGGQTDPFRHLISHFRVAERARGSVEQPGGVKAVPSAAHPILVWAQQQPDLDPGKTSYDVLLWADVHLPTPRFGTAWGQVVPPAGLAVQVPAPMIWGQLGDRFVYPSKLKDACSISLRGERCTVQGCSKYHICVPALYAQCTLPREHDDPQDWSVRCLHICPTCRSVFKSGARCAGVASGSHADCPFGQDHLEIRMRRDEDVRGDRQVARYQANVLPMKARAQRLAAMGLPYKRRRR